MHKIKVHLQSFRFKIVFSAILFLIPAIILPTLWVAQIHTRALMDMDESQTVSSFEIAHINLQSLLADASNAVNVLQTSKAVEDYLVGRFLTSSDKALAKRDFDSAIESVLRMYPYITDILFLKEDGMLVGSSLSWHYTSESTNHPLFQADTYLNSINSTTLQWFDAFNIRYLTQAAAEPSENIYQPTGHRICGLSRLRYTYSGSALSQNVVVLIAVDELAVRQRFSLLFPSEGDLSILNAKGKYISSADESLLDTYAEFFHQIPEDSDFGSFSFQPMNEPDSLIIYSRMPSTNWLLIRRIPLASYRNFQTRLMNLTLTIGMFSLIIISILYVIWVKHLCRPIDEMTKAVIAVRDGDLEMRLPTDPSAPVEIRLMTDQMNAMLESLNELILRNEEIEQRKHILEMRSLQAQITPHFMFNTLTSIRWLASMTGAEKVARMLTSFAHLLRYVFSDWTMEWTLRDELSFARSYIDLIHMRYENKAFINIECSDALLANAVPRFTLQPILENSCEHGMHEGRPLIVDVKIYETDEALTILVQDNGNGMSAETLEHLWKNLQRDDDPPPGANGHRSIGLFNIHKRLSLYYGESYGLHIDSMPGEGTLVTVLIGKRRLGR